MRIQKMSVKELIDRAFELEIGKNICFSKGFNTPKESEGWSQVKAVMHNGHKYCAIETIEPGTGEMHSHMMTINDSEYADVTEAMKEAAILSLRGFGIEKEIYAEV